MVTHQQDSNTCVEVTRPSSTGPVLQINLYESAW